MPYNAVILPQDEDTYVQKCIEGPFSLRYASVRSSDSKESGQPGQDYVSFSVRDEKLTFIVCDGVSQSFYGDFAARYLGDHVISWLYDKMPHTLDAEFLSEHLSQYLNDLSRPAAKEIREHPVPEGVNGLLADVLEEKRSKGSETTFACGLIEFSNDLFADGRALFFWMGNCRLRLGNKKDWGVPVNISPDSDKGKWSTNKGISSGQLRVSARSLTKNGKPRFNRILAYTDGLALLDKINKKPSDSEFDRLIAKAVDSNYSDDCSFLEIELV